MTEEQDGRVFWVVVELHRPKGRVRSRIILHLGEYRDRTEAEAAFAERLKVNPTLREAAGRWALNAAGVLTDRKARVKFTLAGVSTGGIAALADDLLRGRERAEERERARSALRAMGTPLAAFALLGLPPSASSAEVKAAYRRKAFQLHPDRGGDQAAMAKLNAAYEDVVLYATWRD